MVSVKPANSCVFNKALNSWVFVYNLVADVNLIHAWRKVTVITTVDLMVSLLKIKDYFAMVDLIARFEVDSAVLNTIIRNLVD